MFYSVGFVLIASLIGINYYLARRVWRWIHYFAPRFSFAVSLVLFAALTAIMILDFFKSFDGGIQQVITFVGSCWMGVFAYLLLFFLASDVIILLVRLLRVMPANALERVRIAAGAAATVLALMVSAYGIYNASRV